MLVQGTLVDKSINVDIKKSPKSGGGTYKGFRIAIRNDNGEIKEIAKHMNFLKFNPTIAQTLETLNRDDEVTAVMEKEGDFWELKSLTKGKAELPDKSESPYEVAVTKPFTKVAGSTYETAEERKVKQRLIVRQAAINQALEFCQQNYQGEVDGDMTPTRVCKLAAEFEAWVYRDI